FTADASHELRTPLAIIISEAQTILGQERAPREYRESIKVCLDAAQQMRKLTQTLLQLARYDAGQEPIARAAFDLAERTRECLELTRPLAQSRALDVTCDLSPVQVLGDPDRLAQVIINLLGNAIAYNREHGAIHVTVRSDSNQ